MLVRALGREVAERADLLRILSTLVVLKMPRTGKWGGQATYSPVTLGPLPGACTTLTFNMPHTK